MLIAVDTDGVKANLLPEWLRRYNQDYNDNLTVDQITGWDTHKFTKPECGLKMYDYLRQPDLYECVFPLPGAVEGVAELRAMGHEVAFVTSCTYGMVDQKARWYEAWDFCRPRDGHGLPAELIVANTKRWLDREALLIDDRAQTIKEWIESPGYRRAVLVEMPYNRDIDLTSKQWTQVYRASAWPDPSQAWKDIISIVRSMS